MPEATKRRKQSRGVGLLPAQSLTHKAIKHIARPPGPLADLAQERIPALFLVRWFLVQTKILCDANRHANVKPSPLALTKAHLLNRHQKQRLYSRHLSIIELVSDKVPGALVKDGTGWAFLTWSRDTESGVVAEPRRQTEYSKQQMWWGRFVPVDLVVYRFVVQEGNDWMDRSKVHLQQVIHDFDSGQDQRVVFFQVDLRDRHVSCHWVGELVCRQRWPVCHDPLARLEIVASVDTEVASGAIHSIVVGAVGAYGHVARRLGFIPVLDLFRRLCPPVVVGARVVVSRLHALHVVAVVAETG